ncbi:hypothetical protein CKAH01_11091 [Colletotrichum kahawae]|uniref:Uncharacterized protein n=1 Tax=Colletotrichum kahawae TaxID=34407 RepID=A0AAE0CWW9_COLKA|nr:hypothetical protein CKAH01_11091 [Colletotrichum kahawae]
MPCSYYRSSGRRYKLLPRGEVCGECTRLGKSCDAAADAVYAYKFLIPVDAEVAEEKVLRKKATALYTA